MGVGIIHLFVGRSAVNMWSVLFHRWKWVSILHLPSKPSLQPPCSLKRVGCLHTSVSTSGLLHANVWKSGFPFPGFAWNIRCILRTCLVLYVVLCGQFTLLLLACLDFSCRFIFWIRIQHFTSVIFFVFPSIIHHGVRESVHRETIMKVTNKMQLYRLIYYS